MPSIRTDVIAQSNLTVYTVEGPILAAEVENAIEHFYRGQVTKNVLWNLARADVSGISAQEVSNISDVPRTAKDSRRGGKTALVAPADLVFGLSRAYTLQTGLNDLPFQTRVFRSLAEACTWLEVPPAQVERLADSTDA